jgi:hypothetical protein
VCGARGTPLAGFAGARADPIFRGLARRAIHGALASARILLAPARNARAITAEKRIGSASGYRREPRTRPEPHRSGPHYRIDRNAPARMTGSEARGRTHARTSVTRRGRAGPDAMRHELADDGDPRLTRTRGDNGAEARA